MNSKDAVLGIDTSNYKTSVAVVDSAGQILCDLRKPLRVKQGERGLRQSEAFFQHIENLPLLLAQAFGGNQNGRIGAVASACRPRPVEGSYMPVFTAGESFGQSAAAALGIPYYGFSHQEGHIQAIQFYSSLKETDQLLCYHLSGGTCELLKVEGGQIEKIGGSNDLSFGQLIDRIGVSLGMAFPAGEAMDRLAATAGKATKLLKKIPMDQLFIHVSGMETQCSRLLKTLTSEEETKALVKELFDKISDVLIELTKAAVQKTTINDIMFTGGVASSQYIRQRITAYFLSGNSRIEFGKQELSQDNAVGIALLGRKQQWPSNQ